MTSVFQCGVYFCPTCGALLPPVPRLGDMICLACKSTVSLEPLADSVSSYQIVFNQEGQTAMGKKAKKKKKKKKKSKKGTDDQSEEEFSDADGPTVDRRCRKCGYEKMSYAAIQLRSADEGQTVFFTCVRCHFKESENS